MDSIQLPSRIEVGSREANSAQIVIEPCYPGYGTTLGNALRRVLLSSLPGAAVTKVRIVGATHEFSTLPNVEEDIVDLVLNLKLLRVKIHEGEEAVLKLHAKGEKTVTAGDLDLPSNVEVSSKDLVIATLTDKSAELELEITVQKGRGYVPVESQVREKGDIGLIAIDAIYTPIKTVNFKTENVRVGQMTNYDRLTIDITTDGTTTPEGAFRQAAEILVNHFSLFHDAELGAPEKTARKRTKKAAKETTEAATDEAPAAEPAAEPESKKE
ncbi:MAG: DNA-directed RNA polymerase subunit alpha [Candidatus Kerfeldbacteria bacterium]|nr:DNA-directed RNA polymerase subunit alpha [Candidatus Kerfeldbacteria bacterium]